MNEKSQTSRFSAAGIITAAALIPIFTYSLVMALTNTLINEIVNEFNLEGASVGLMSSMASLGFMLSLLFIPMVQGRIKKITILIAACAVQAIMLFVSGISPTFVFFLFMCVILGASGGFIDAYCNSSVVDARGEKSPKYLGYLHGLFGVGSLIAPVVILWLLLQINWRGIYSLLAVVSLLTAVVVFLLTRGRSIQGEINATTGEQRLNKADLKEYVGQKRNMMLLFAAFFSQVILAGVMSWILRYMTVRFGGTGDIVFLTLTAEDMGILSLTLFWVGATINRFFFSSFINKAPMKFFILGSLISGIAITAGVISDSPTVMFFMVGILGLVCGHFIPVLVSECAKGYEGKTTFTTSILMLVMGICRIIVPVLVASASVWISPSFSMMIPAAAALITVFFGWMITKTAVP